jgi:ribonuclease HII
MCDGLFEPEKNFDPLVFEKCAFLKGYNYVAGIDEAGRGALAGPVVAAAVIFPKDVEIRGIDDSKKLTPSKRESLFDPIMEKSVEVGVGIGDHILIDEINILQATLFSMKKAILGLSTRPDYLLVDGNCSIPVNIPQKAIIKGDSSSISIAAASIIAKVTRDRLMVEYDKIYPDYGFAGHKGYGSASHLSAIAEIGPCDIHRKTFRGVREFVKIKLQDQLFGTGL